LAHRVVGEVRLEEAQSQRLVEDVLDELLAVDVRIELARLVHARDDLPEGSLALLPQLVRSQRVEVQTAQVERFDQAVVSELQRAAVIADGRNSLHRWRRSCLRGRLRLAVAVPRLAGGVVRPGPGRRWHLGLWFA